MACIVGYGLWQARAHQAHTLTSVDALLIELLSPSVRAASALRNALMADSPDRPIESPVGLARLRQLEAENRELRAALTLRDTLPTRGIAAEVIGRGSMSWQDYLLLGKGRDEGLAPCMVVLTPSGVLGQVASVTAHTAVVLPLTDAASGIGAMTVRTGATGVLKGSREGACHLVYLSGKADIQPGDQVVTSGLGQVFPAGLPLGTVAAVTATTAVFSKDAHVLPATDPATVRIVVVVK